MLLQPAGAALSQAFGDARGEADDGTTRPWADALAGALEGAREGTVACVLARAVEEEAEGTAEGAAKGAAKGAAEGATEGAAEGAAEDREVLAESLGTGLRLKLGRADGEAATGTTAEATAVLSAGPTNSDSSSEDLGTRMTIESALKASQGSRRALEHTSMTITVSSAGEGGTWVEAGGARAAEGTAGSEEGTGAAGGAGEATGAATRAGRLVQLALRSTAANPAVYGGDDDRCSGRARLTTASERGATNRSASAGRSSSRSPEVAAEDGLTFAVELASTAAIGGCRCVMLEGDESRCSAVEGGAPTRRNGYDQSVARSA